MTRPPLHLVPPPPEMAAPRANVLQMLDAILDAEAELPGLLDNADVGALRGIRRRLAAYVTRPGESSP